MKMLFTLTIFSLVCFANAAQAADTNLPSTREKIRQGNSHD